MNYILFLVTSSFDDFKRNKVRTILTSLGILIGVLSVVLLIAFGIGLKNYIRNQFESLGTNLIIVVPGQVLQGGGFRSGGGTLGGAQFGNQDVSRIKRIEAAQLVAPVFIKTVQVSSPNKAEVSDLYASTPDLFPLRNLEVDKGQLFDEGDNQKRAKKAVIGPKIAEKLFGSSDAAIGKKIQIQNQGFTIIGILKQKGGGGFGGPDFDTFTYIPFKASSSFNPDKIYAGIYIKAENETAIPQLKSDVQKVLLRRYEEDDFSVIEQTEILQAVTSIFSILNTVLIAIGSISLLVGGIGIMNIMYATVTERIKEIGIRRAIGATRRDILLQFLVQAIILSLFGGLLGLVLSFAIVFLIQPVFPASINAISVAAALGVSSLIGIFFGVFPARRAANLSPIDAIRYE